MDQIPTFPIKSMDMYLASKAPITLVGVSQAKVLIFRDDVLNDCKRRVVAVFTKGSWVGSRPMIALNWRVLARQPWGFLWFGECIF